MHPRLALAESINFRKCGRCAILLTRDLRDAIAQGNAKARLAVDKFTWTIAKWIGSYVAELGGLDMPVFTGGIGENDIASRAEICAGLGALGIVLDAARNNVRAAGSCVHELALFRGIHHGTIYSKGPAYWSVPSSLRIESKGEPKAMDESKRKTETSWWQPSRSQLAKWHMKNTLGTAVFLGIMALGALLYLAFTTLLSHHLFHHRH
jgi:hypothetical protein